MALVLKIPFADQYSKLDILHYCLVGNLRCIVSVSWASRHDANCEQWKPR